MQEDSIKLIKQEDRTAEAEIHKKIGRDLLKILMSEFDVNLILIFEDNRVNIKHAQGFNRLLTHIKKAGIMELSDCLLLIEEEYASFKRIKTILNDENLDIVKRELAEKHRIKLPKNCLENFIFNKKRG